MLKKVLPAAMMLILSQAMLSGCSSGNKPGQKIHDRLEKAVAIEQGFVKCQKQLLDKEKKEQHLYGEIIKLNTDKFGQIVTLSKKASGLAGERKQLMKGEKKVFDKAYKKFAEVKPLVQNLDNPALKKKADVLIKAMDKRNNAYNRLYKAYVGAISFDQKLYQMLEKKNVKQTDLQKQINKINKEYKVINNEKRQFNKFTEHYNHEKKAFYQATGIKR